MLNAREKLKGPFQVSKRDKNRVKKGLWAGLLLVLNFS